MKKPTDLQVKMYFAYKGIEDQSQYKKFLAYYYSVGWYIGKQPMRSWKAAIAGWVLRMEDYKKPEESTHIMKKSVWDNDNKRT